ncbi:MAG: agmatinase family protein [Proteobacteria bacterium]|nr:agmatinase family protein [Pseudomonadota bacterium]
MKKFDPNAAAAEDSGIFGLPYTVEQAQLIIIPVPWEATTSYGGGTAMAPQAIFDASKQVDLFDFELGNFYEAGIAMLENPAEISVWNHTAKQEAAKIIKAAGIINTAELKNSLQRVNELSVKINDYVYQQTQRWLSQGKCVGILGGDHSSPFGAVQAFLEHYPEMGILHFDAHADLRSAYEGFEFSHASIMNNIINKTALKKLVQVGIRDFCEEEIIFIQEHSSRITPFYDSVLTDRKLQGQTWDEVCEEIIHSLPKQVYISFDIDGLDPRFCPHTGTPVPGGLDLKEAWYLIKKVGLSGRKIIGFDLNEVSLGSTKLPENPDPYSEWDANVGARLLYKLCGWALNSRLA